MASICAAALGLPAANVSLRELPLAIAAPTILSIAAPAALLLLLDAPLSCAVPSATRLSTPEIASLANESAACLVASAVAAACRQGQTELHYCGLLLLPLATKLVHHDHTYTTQLLLYAMQHNHAHELAVRATEQPRQVPQPSNRRISCC